MEALRRICSLIMKPLRKNINFFVFMYLLGCACAWATLPNTRGAKLYDNLFPELFLDIYFLCVLLSVLPRKVMLWVRALFYAVFYAAAVVDVYCFVKFDSTLTPTMLLLVGETDSREAGEFIKSCVSPDVVFSPLGWVLFLMLCHLLCVLRLRFPHFIPRRQREAVKSAWQKVLSWLRKGLVAEAAVVVVLLVWALISSAHNKQATWELMTGRTIGEVEHTLTEKDHAVLYVPVYRLAFSIYANTLTAKQTQRLIATVDKARVDSCSFRSPNIVLIIGESYNRHHSQMYGYAMPTTPRQLQLERKGRLVRFDDVVSPWNLTSFVFKHLFSLYTVGQKGEWCDYPLFPVLFRKAGYHVTFITNQFLPKAKEAVYDFSGGFFLNDRKLSAAQFDTRNTQLHAFDEALLKDYDNLKSANTDNNLIIFHLLGQHVAYRQRSPRDRKRFHASDYKELKPNLNDRERTILSDYDNAILYNDSVVTEIVKKFENDDAIVIYVPDHGEECYEGDMHFYCRLHSAKVDARLAHAEFDIPFWIWCSRKYVKNRPEVFRQVVQAKHRRFMTDALPHLLLYLGGISAPSYHEEFNLLSPDYNELRPRILKGVADYDKL